MSRFCGCLAVTMNLLVTVVFIGVLIFVFHIVARVHFLILVVIGSVILQLLLVQTRRACAVGPTGSNLIAAAAESTMAGMKAEISAGHLRSNCSRVCSAVSRSSSSDAFAVARTGWKTSGTRLARRPGVALASVPIRRTIGFNLTGSVLLSPGIIVLLNK